MNRWATIILVMGVLLFPVSGWAQQAEYMGKLADEVFDAEFDEHGNLYFSTEFGIFFRDPDGVIHPVEINDNRERNVETELMRPRMIVPLDDSSLIVLNEFGTRSDSLWDTSILRVESGQPNQLWYSGEHRLPEWNVRYNGFRYSDLAVDDEMNLYYWFNAPASSSIETINLYRMNLNEPDSPEKIELVAPVGEDDSFSYRFRSINNLRWSEDGVLVFIGSIGQHSSSNRLIRVYSGTIRLSPDGTFENAGVNTLGFGDGSADWIDERYLVAGIWDRRKATIALFDTMTGGSRDLLDFPLPYITDERFFLSSPQIRDLLRQTYVEYDSVRDVLYLVQADGHLWQVREMSSLIETRIENWAEYD